MTGEKFPCMAIPELSKFKLLFEEHLDCADLGFLYTFLSLLFPYFLWVFYYSLILA